MSIEDVPDDCIVHIASFMDEKNFLNFIKSNKNIILYPFTLSTNAYVWKNWTFTKYYSYIKDYIVNLKLKDWTVRKTTCISGKELEELYIEGHSSNDKIIFNTPKLTILNISNIVCNNIEFPLSIRILYVYRILFNNNITKLDNLEEIHINSYDSNEFPLNIKKIFIGYRANSNELYFNKYNKLEILSVSEVKKNDQFPESLKKLYIRGFMGDIDIKNVEEMQVEYIYHETQITKRSEKLKKLKIIECGRMPFEMLDAFPNLEELYINTRKRDKYHKTRSYTIMNNNE